MNDYNLVEEISQRRTFAIISHPDAGKTTLTEKLLLYSGMIRTAGMVRGRKGSKATSSDWMAMEQERGISITASAMQFRYKDAVINVLDTPGHQDFSEDTYRTLTAADSAIMVIDAAKGVETQTKKLFAVCKIQKTPVLTFVNKMDLPSRDILELLEEIENVLGVHSTPINWPIGYGKNFCGVINIADRVVSLFKRSDEGNADRAIIEQLPLSKFEKRSDVDPDTISRLKEELELLEIAGNEFSKEKYLRGEITPVFFGSALTNFGVEPFFDAFVDLAPSPKSYTAFDKTGEEILISPDTEDFSGYVFKIQSNMNPKHRDSMAFIRVCSGTFERDIVVKHHRTNKEVRLSRSYAMVARDRDTVDLAFPGDIVGFINPGAFRIGDTVSAGKLFTEQNEFNYKKMPSFPPEIMASIRPKDVLRKKSFDKGIRQLSEEGTIQLLWQLDVNDTNPYVAAVGKLQFDVLSCRLKDEYNVDLVIDFLPYRFSSYLTGVNNPKTLKKTQGSTVVRDESERLVLLVTSEWEKRYLVDNNEGVGIEEFL